MNKKAMTVKNVYDLLCYKQVIQVNKEGAVYLAPHVYYGGIAEVLNIVNYRVKSIETENDVLIINC